MNFYNTLYDLVCTFDEEASIHHFKQCIGMLSDVSEIETQLLECIRNWNAMYPDSTKFKRLL
ncbi:hypothetical protein H5410_032665 [Solanum commersonii]|uniref:Uncharacterized protein n=1 Tax=Solanum commersonii TaxID=4109 RepID=A0A9J5YNJ4_SOLCO|nr:hypothetical protein H5410_032665 [Solanum commersonii]